LRGNSLTDSEGTDRSIGSVGTGISLSKGRGGSVGKRVETWWVGGIGITLGERVVGVAEMSALRSFDRGKYSLSRHNPVASHFIEGVLAFLGGRIGGVLGDTDTKTELFERHVADPSVQAQIEKESTTYFIHSSYETSVPVALVVTFPPTGLPSPVAPCGSSSPP
jgi:hypothetical protein